MKWIRYIWIMIIIYLVCSSRTCNEDEEAAARREEQDVIKLIENVENVFTTDTLDINLLRAYELTAMDKLTDFADYMKVISDTTLNLRFRQQAEELVRTFFISGEVQLQAWSRQYPVPELNTLDLLIDYSISEGISYWIQPVRVNVRDQFVRENDSTFTGTLSFFQKCISFPEIDQIEDLSGPFVMDIYLMRKIKFFGIQQLGVWEVHLGAIEDDKNFRQ